jgi:anti-sigma factor RsiW
MSSAPDRRKLVPPHLPDSMLLAYLDGEHSRAETETTRAHLESCWSCRRRLSALEASIADYLDQSPPLQPHLALDGEQRVRQFRERLARHAATSELSLGDALRAYWSRLASGVAAHRRAVLASVVAACFLVAMFTDALGTRVSADTVLNRAQSFETMHRPRLGQVNRVALRLDRVQRHSGAVQPLGTITVIEDSDQPQSVVTAESASGDRQPALLASRDLAQAPPQLALLAQDLPAPMAAYLHSQHWLPSVTVEAFRELTAGRGITAASVQKESGAFVLIYPFAEGHPSGISEAHLRVDRSTFATMGLSLFLGSPAEGVEYRFTRTATSIEPRTTEIARLFQPHELTKSTHLPTVREPARITPLTYATTHATDEEVRLTVALHKSDACMGEEIHVFPMSDGSLLVQGLVDKSDRRDAVLKALRSVDATVPSQIYLPRELKSGSQLFNLPYQMPEIPSTLHGTPGATLADLSSQRIPLYEQLFQHFSRPGAAAEDTEKQINAFSNEAVTLARQTFLHAWALKKLDLEFSAERSANLSPAGMQELERMRQDHRRWIATLSHRQSEMLSQVGGVPAQQLASGSSKPLDPDTVLQLAREQNDLVRSLFTVSNGTAETSSNVVRLLAVLHRMGA